VLLCRCARVAIANTTKAKGMVDAPFHRYEEVDDYQEFVKKGE
jgi:hypothetical protein